jgi:regulator of protease activity HflC (stomatin/prohibitin superfamily)
VTDDPTRSPEAIPTAEAAPVPLDEQEPGAGPHLQITELEAGPTEAAEAIERRDAYGRVPVVVRVRRQPPIRIEAVLLAVALGASGLLLPVFLALRAVIIVGAVLALVIGFVSRIFIRIPPGAVGLTVRSGRPGKVLEAGVHTTNPFVILSHLVTSRDIAFDVPVSEVRSSDGVAVTVDLMLTLRINEPQTFAYQVATGDADALVHAAAQDAVRSTLRGIASLDALDLGPDQAAILRSTIDASLARLGISVQSVSFTRVSLPAAFTASLEARRLAAVQLAEEGDAFTLEERRLANRAALIVQEAEARRLSVEKEAAAEALRLARLEERIGANPKAAAYDLEVSRIRIAERLAGNSRAVVSMTGPDLVASALLTREAGRDAAPDIPSPAS